MRMFIMLLLLLQISPVIGQDNESIVDSYFTVIKYQNDTTSIKNFITKMPKGGDLHNHFTGAIPVETYLQWAADANMVYDTIKNAFDTVSNSNSITVDELRNNAHLLGKWSIEGYNIPCNGQINVATSAPHFFGVPNFGAIRSFKSGYLNGMNELKSIAVKENVQYIESMYRSPGIDEKRTSLS